MDRSDEILDAIVAICEGIGIETELDRAVPVSEKEAPRFVVRTGSEELTPPENARLETCSRFWTISPQVELYQAGGTPSAMRAENSRVWSEFRTAFFQSPIMGMLAHGSLPAIERNVVSPSSDPSISGFFIDLSLAFKR